LKVDSNGKAGTRNALFPAVRVPQSLEEISITLFMVAGSKVVAEGPPQGPTPHPWFFVSVAAKGLKARVGSGQCTVVTEEELGRVRKEYGFLLVGYVVTPNHGHVLMSEPKKGTPSTVLQMLKQRVSRRMRKRERYPTPKAQLPLVFSRFIADLPQFRQPRSYDFNVYSHRRRKRSWTTCTQVR